MLTPMNRAGGLPANLQLQMIDEGRLVDRHVPIPLAHLPGGDNSFRLTFSFTRSRGVMKRVGCKRVVK